ncbi:hypothetical protein [Henriciella sp.]|uniref:Bbp19 family protein n=1 Tax=Henriciella sp. TaxID=1968823 RepID=UPI00261D90E5|nr:hypothetical protein [Henriciella sp.]
MDWETVQQREKRREEISEKKRQRAIEVDESLKAILQTPDGRRVMSEILGKCGLTRSNFTGNSETFKLEGRREVALVLADWMGRVDPNAARQIIGELYVRHDD